MARARVLPSPGVPGAVWTIVVAAGAGSASAGRSSSSRSVGRRGPRLVAGGARGGADGVVVVVPPGRAPGPSRLRSAGGATRSDSVRCGLAAVPGRRRRHRRARRRPAVRLRRAVRAPSIDAVRGGADGAVPGRAGHRHRQAVDDGRCVVRHPTGDARGRADAAGASRAAALRARPRRRRRGHRRRRAGRGAGGRVVVVAGEAANRKLTVPDDLAWARQRVAGER